MRYAYTLNSKGLKAGSVYALNREYAPNNGVRLTTRVYGIHTLVYTVKQPYRTLSIWYIHSLYTCSKYYTILLTAVCTRFVGNIFYTKQLRISTVSDVEQCLNGLNSWGCINMSYYLSALYLLEYTTHHRVFESMWLANVVCFIVRIFIILQLSGQ